MCLVGTSYSPVVGGMPNIFLVDSIVFYVYTVVGRPNV